MADQHGLGAFGFTLIHEPNLNGVTPTEKSGVLMCKRLSGANGLSGHKRAENAVTVYLEVSRPNRDTNLCIVKYRGLAGARYGPEVSG